MPCQTLLLNTAIVYKEPVIPSKCCYEKPREDANNGCGKMLCLHFSHPPTEVGKLETAHDVL